MNTSIDSLCDLWMVLFKLCNRDGIEDEECTAIVNTMSAVEKALVSKIKKDAHIIKLLAVLTDFGDSEFPRGIDPLLKAYAPSSESPVKKVA
ncbi:hypothetical protein [Bartonella sp. CB74]|uniref:hypothetical protein n=1 Tax=Bartonella sp. CB74 TaxID=3113620 RepID=UPI002F96D7F4